MTKSGVDILKTTLFMNSKTTWETQVWFEVLWKSCIEFSRYLEIIAIYNIKHFDTFHARMETSVRICRSKPSHFCSRWKVPFLLNF